MWFFCRFDSKDDSYNIPWATECVTDLDLRQELLIFWVNFDPFWSEHCFFMQQGQYWKLARNLACPNLWNTLYKKEIRLEMIKMHILVTHDHFCTLTLTVITKSIIWIVPRVFVITEFYCIQREVSAGWKKLEYFFALLNLFSFRWMLNSQPLCFAVFIFKLLNILVTSKWWKYMYS